VIVVHGKAAACPACLAADGTSLLLVDQHCRVFQLGDVPSPYEMAKLLASDAVGTPRTPVQRLSTAADASARGASGCAPGCSPRPTGATDAMGPC